MILHRTWVYDIFLRVHLSNIQPVTGTLVPVTVFDRDLTASFKTVGLTAGKTFWGAEESLVLL